MRKKSFGKKILFFFLILFSLAGILFFYFNRILLPVKAKAFIVRQAETALNRRVSIGQVRFDLLKGLILSDLRVTPREFQEKHFIRAEEVTLSLLFAPLIKSKKIIFSSIQIKNPLIYLIRYEDGRWNFSDLARTAPTASSKKKKGFSVFMRKLTLDGGEIHYLDKTPIEDVIETIQHISATTKINLTQTMDFTLQADIPSQGSSLSASGSYDWTKQELFSQIEASNINIAEYLPLYLRSLEAQSGLVSSAKTTLEFQKNQLTLKGYLAAENINMLFDKKIKIQGSLTASDAFYERKNGESQAKGSFVFKDFLLHGQEKVFKGTLSSKIGHLVWRKADQWSIQGQMTAQKAFTQWEPGKSVQGNITADHMDVTKKPSSLKLTGNFRLTETKLNLNEDKEFQSREISANDFSLTQHQGTVSASGIVQVQEAKAQWAPDQHYQGDLSIPQLSFSKNDQELLFKSDVYLKNAEFNFNPQQEAKGDFLFRDADVSLINQRWRLNTDLEWLNGYARLSHDRIITGDFFAPKTRLNYEDKKWTVTTSSHLDQGNITWGPTFKFQGQPVINGSLSVDPSLDESIVYGGDITFNGGTLTGLPQINRLQDIHGKLSVKTDQLSTEKLTLTLQDQPVTLSGMLTNFQNPILDISAKAEEADLTQLLSYVPSSFFKKTGLKAEGQTDLTVHYHGHLDAPQKADINAEARLINVRMDSTDWPDPIDEISGEISYQNDLILWKNLSGMFEGHTYGANGRLSNFSRPIFETEVKSNNLDLATKIKILNQAFTIVDFNGHYLDSSFNISGEVHLTDPGSPRVDIKGVFGVELKNLPEIIAELKILPATQTASLKEKIENLNPHGSVEISGLFRGPLKDPRDWETALTMTSPKIWIKENPLHQVNIDYAQRDRHLEWKGQSALYNGTLSLEGIADIRGNAIPAQAKLELKNFDLAVLRQNKKIKQKNISGKLSLTAEGTGPLNKPEQWTGEGAAVIVDGFLGQLIPQISEAVFTSASANFTIKNRKIITTNAKAFSETIDLNAQGWIDFNQNIDFDIYPSLNASQQVQTQGLRIDPSAIISRALIIKKTGTLSKPVTEIKTSPASIIGDTLGTTTNIIREGLGTLLEELF